MLVLVSHALGAVCGLQRVRGLHHVTDYTNATLTLCRTIAMIPYNVVSQYSQ